MRSIWFKKCYVEAILSGEKTTTIRAKCPNVGVGDLVRFQVGAKPPFAVVRVLDIEQIKLSDLSKERRDSVRAIYGDIRTAWRVTFKLTDPPEDRQMEFCA
ncbi:MAG: ASCH domain-containing protein [Planctomycetes bacterium]|nr:ASCH domain-containing protein [Planctomycetota bacterium]